MSKRYLNIYTIIPSTRFGCRCLDFVCCQKQFLSATEKPFAPYRGARAQEKKIMVQKVAVTGYCCKKVNAKKNERNNSGTDEE